MKRCALPPSSLPEMLLGFDFDFGGYLPIELEGVLYGFHRAHSC